MRKRLVRKRLVVVTGLIVALAVVLAGCGDDAASPPRGIVIGSSDDAAMRVMAEVYAGALRNAGSVVSADRLRGDDATLLDEMDRADLDLFPAFTGDLLTMLAPSSTAVGAEDVYVELNRSLPQGVSVGDETPVSGAPQIFVSTALAGSVGATGLDDCALLPAGLPVVATSDPDPATLNAFTSAGCRLGPVETVDTTDQVLRRAADGNAVGLLTPLDIAGEDAEGASSDVQALRNSEGGGDTPDNAPDGGEASTEREPAAEQTGPRAEVLVPVFRSAALNRDQVKTMNKVAGEITTADLATMSGEVETGSDPRDVALEWLAEHGL
ncbi:glycine/betaine ABC transporter substrate-binding protein [Gordonia amicalis]|uniref:Glycine betaine ABC transporter substrate-binding protein n=1 Tax=Gordonia amicalis TaxID=89053 RepID=A0ABU4DHM3_9ACTN|nr:glycine betaine ABC transporter substrate-binding protein [Gordonia amicalis]MCZ4577956.1 glycine/betaine ABC transporter substrate-binding protein [Gordonia amicalis]MDV6308891.1 glycine betaine ABC transporter substrate-binding protein [Gordonia amicalis]MDV7101710.1 glycine betaine ABC transporter substrate-binding protein [Gordonia amicalis]